MGVGLNLGICYKRIRYEVFASFVSLLIKQLARKLEEAPEEEEGGGGVKLRVSSLL